MGGVHGDTVHRTLEETQLLATAAIMTRVLEKAMCPTRTVFWRGHPPLQKLAMQMYQNQEAKPFLCALSLELSTGKV